MHALGGQPGNGVSGNVMVFKCCVELRDKIGESSKGKWGARDGTLAEGRSPGEGGPLSHVQEGEGNLFLIGVIDGLIDKEVELYSV